MSREVIDLTHTLDGNISVYPGDPAYACHPFLTVPKDGNAVSSISLGSHTGTHIDAPSHFFEGAMAVDSIPLEQLIGAAVVVDLAEKVTKRQKIEWSDLECWEEKMKALVGDQWQYKGGMLLIRTGWDRYWGTSAYFDHPFLSKDAAQRIVATGITLIGVDTLSPDETLIPTESVPEPQYDFGVHEAVLGSGGFIVENLTRLDNIADGQWIVSLLPLKIGGCDGSPIRACAWRTVD